MEADKRDTLDEVDRLKAENLQLKVANLMYEKRDKIEAVLKVDKELEVLKKEVNEFQIYLTEKYSLDFSTQHIQAGSGRIVDGGAIGGN